MTKVLLYSGGMDSWLIDKIWKPDIKLYVHMNGAYSLDEIARLPADVKTVFFPLGQFEEVESKYIPMRNLYLLMIASNYGDEICYGATLGDYGAIDKRPEFIDKAEEMINYTLGKQSVSEGKKIHIERRFVKMSKNEILDEYLRMGGTIEEAINNTFSCFTPMDGKACLNCKPCFRKFMLGYGYGYEYSQQEKIQMRRYIIDHELNRTSHGTYYKDRKGEGKFLSDAVDKLFEEEFNE